MRQTARIVIDADPEIKKMLEEMKQSQGKTIKEIVENLIRDAYKEKHS